MLHSLCCIADSITARQPWWQKHDECYAWSEQSGFFLCEATQSQLLKNTILKLTTLPFIFPDERKVNFVIHLPVPLSMFVVPAIVSNWGSWQQCCSVFQISLGNLLHSAHNQCSLSYGCCWQFVAGVNMCVAMLLLLVP